MHPTISALAGFVWPTFCASCGCRLLPQSIPVCPACIRRVEIVDVELLKSRLALRGLSASLWKQVFSLWMFDKSGPVRHLHHAWKYGGCVQLGMGLGRLLGRELHARLPIDSTSPEEELLIPIPLARVRQLERGYNQSAVLARGVAAVTRHRLPRRVLERTRATRSQVGLTLERRRRNVLGAFALARPEMVAGRHVWLVDDLITTGATLWAATLPLHRAGAASVSILTLSAARIA